MCGLAGVILGEKKGSKRELIRIRDLFTSLLIRSEHRGPFATGVAVVRADGSVLVEKAPLPASGFVETQAYLALTGNLDSTVTCLMGHTRWPTRGTHLDNRNNQPLISEDGTVVLTHNGTITNCDTLFRRLALLRTAQVDSEVLLRLAVRNTTSAGIDLDGFVDDLGFCAGRLSLVTVAALQPSRVILVKGNQPLVVRLSRRPDLYAYASEPAILGAADCVGAQWQSVCLPAWHVLTIDTTGIIQFGAVPMVAKRGEHYSAWDA